MDVILTRSPLLEIQINFFPFIVAVYICDFKYFYWFKLFIYFIEVMLAYVVNGILEA